MMNRKLICFDIDNTLICYKDEPSIPDSTIEALDRLRSKGHIIAVATGRSLMSAFFTMNRLGITHAVLHNGAQVVQDGVPIYENRISTHASAQLRDFLLNTQCTIYAFDGLHCYVHNVDDGSRNWIKYESGREDSVRELADADGSFLSLCVYGDVSQAFSLFESLPEITYIKDLSEVTRTGVNKGVGISVLAQHFGIDIADVIAVGDGTNDLEMIQTAGIGIAVGNACDELKAVADLVSNDICEGGILEIFERLEII